MKIVKRIALLFSLIPSLLLAQWTEIAPMAGSRAGHVSVALNDGEVLVAGGWDFSTNLTSAERYNSSTDTWSSASSMSSEHYSAGAVRLNDGRVLVISGFNGTFNTEACDIYDPVSGVWEAAGFLSQGRSFFTTTLLNDGKVLVTGGFDGSDNLATCEIYDPAADSWTSTTSMLTGRSYHTASLLPDGRVMVCGGFNPNAGFQLNSVEIYDPADQTWITTMPMSIGRDYHAASVLLDGRVLVSGGRYFNGSLNYAYNGLNSAEVFSPISETWETISSLPMGISYHQQVTLNDGNVLLVAGVDSSNYSSTDGFTTFASITMMYDVSGDSWEFVDMNFDARYEFGISKLSNGNVLVTGGGDASAELYEVDPLRTKEVTETNFKVFPNPSSVFAAISLANNQTIQTMEVYSIEGKLLKEISLNGQDSQVMLNTAEFPAGMYLISIRTNSGEKLSTRLLKH